MCSRAQATTFDVILKSSTPKKAASNGQAIQVAKILNRASESVGDPLKRFQPMMAPTMALAGRDGKPELGHPVDRQRRGKGRHARPRHGVDGPKPFPRYGPRRPPEITAPKITEETAHRGRDTKAQHARAHRCSEDIGGIIGPQRPNRERDRPARKTRDRDFQSAWPSDAEEWLLDRPLYGVDRQLVGDLLGHVGDPDDALGEKP